MAPLNAFMQKEGWKLSQFKGKYAAQLPMFIQMIWLKGTFGMYVSKKLMLLVAIAELWKPVNWAQVIFNNLHIKLQDLSTTSKTKKENLGKEIEFGVAQVVDTILWHWLLVDPTFQLSKFENENEEEDNF